MQNNHHPRVLLLSNNALRVGGSNGKVLQELFEGWNPECLAQFYIYDEQPDFTVCRRFYRVTDYQALQALLKGKQGGGPVISEPDSVGSAAVPALGGGVGRNPLTCLLRELVWDSRRWQSRDFWKWVEEFAPQILLLQVGDSAFMPHLAMQICGRYNIPLAFYCTENYYFKKHNYFLGAGATGWKWLYPLFRANLTRAFRKMMGMSSCQIYNSQPLEALHRNAFGKSGEVLYQATSLKGTPKEKDDQPLRCCYAGNLGLGRHNSLIEIAEVLQRIEPTLVLNIYGRAEPDVREALAETPGICYHGAVDYAAVCRAMEESDLLFHAESFDPDIVKDLETAFSTKIADSLASGRCFVLYAHESLACTRYLREQGGAYVITSPEQLEPELRELVQNADLRKALIARGLELARQNHDSAANSRAFLEIMNAACANNEENTNG